MSAEPSRPTSRRDCGIGKVMRGPSSSRGRSTASRPHQRGGRGRGEDGRENAGRQRLRRQEIEQAEQEGGGRGAEAGAGPAVGPAHPDADHLGAVEAHGPAVAEAERGAGLEGDPPGATDPLRRLHAGQDVRDGIGPRPARRGHRARPAQASPVWVSGVHGAAVGEGRIGGHQRLERRADAAERDRQAPAPRRSVRGRVQGRPP